MKKTIIASLLVVMVLGIGIGFAYQEETGRGGPSGPHFNLNIIGMQKDKKADFDENCGNGHRIFVPMEGTKSGRPPVKIMLIESPDDEFAVIDCDGTDGTAAFMLPNPDPGDESNCTRYSVWIRPLGAPGGKATIVTCAEECTIVDPDTGDCELWEEICSVEDVKLERTKGKQRFVNVSKELLTICAEVCTEYDEETGECITREWMRLYLFDPLLRDYYWKYDNNGLKLAQLRFYMEPTCYSENDWACPPTE
jgi:hypothetical protein